MKITRNMIFLSLSMIVHCTVRSEGQFGYLKFSRFLNSGTVISDYTSKLHSIANPRDSAAYPCPFLVSSYLNDIELLCNYEYIIAISKSCLALSSQKNAIHSYLTNTNDKAQKELFDKSILFFAFNFKFTYDTTGHLIDIDFYLLLISKISIYISDKIKGSTGRLGELVENSFFRDEKESDLILFLYNQYTAILSEFEEVFDLFIVNVYDKDACDLLKNKLRDNGIILEPLSAF